MAEKNSFDIAIIGGGPVGMFALFYSQLRNVNATLIESLPELGGQVNALYSDKIILDVAGFANISGSQLIENLNQQLRQFNDLNIKTNSTVINIEKKDNQFEITTKTEKIFAKTIILATGKGDFKPRKLQIDNVDTLSKVSYIAKSSESYKDKIVAIAGGGDTALETALQISQSATKTYLIHRNDHYSALESTIDKVNQSDVEQLINAKITSLTENDDKLIIEIDEKRIEVDDLVVNFGLISDNKLLKEWNLDFEFDNGFLKTNSNQATNIDGIFAIGDISHYPGKAELIATGFGEALTALNSAVEFYRPGSAGPVHSTVQKITDGILTEEQP